MSMSSCPPYPGVGEVAVRYVALVHHVHVHHVNILHAHVHHVHSPSHNHTITISPSPYLCHHLSVNILSSQFHYHYLAVTISPSRLLPLAVTISPSPSRQYHLAVTIFHRPLTSSAIWQTTMSLSGRRKTKKRKERKTLKGRHPMGPTIKYIHKNLILIWSFIRNFVKIFI